VLPVVQDAVARDVNLVARAPAGMRSYRISRMSKPVALAMPFKRPAKFDLAAYWKRSTAELGRQWERYPATLALAPEAVSSLRGWYQLSPAAAELHSPELPPGWVVFDVVFERLSLAQFVALGLGPRARVLAPVELRELVSADIAAAAQQ
jgi:predicted DNA-binding transcriptional regulator YafY